MFNYRYCFDDCIFLQINNIFLEDFVVYSFNIKIKYFMVQIFDMFIITFMYRIL